MGYFIRAVTDFLTDYTKSYFVGTKLSNEIDTFQNISLQVCSLLVFFFLGGYYYCEQIKEHSIQE